MALKKDLYELSVWTENDNDGVKTEKRGTIIGAPDMNYQGKATAICLKRDIKGTATLSFQMPSKYFDSEIGEYIHNDFVDIIKTETKIKLFYKEKWYEFIVKKITENKKLKAIMYTYECQDSFIDELSRTGYDIEFAPELNNSVNEIGIFMEDILENSLWDYTPEYNIGDFTEYNEQKFYRIPLSQFKDDFYGYPIDFLVDISMFLQDDNTPTKSFAKYLKRKNINWDEIVEQDKVESTITTLITVYNVLNDTSRQVEFGDDLARELEIFWDNHKDDNGISLLDVKNKIELSGKYIYVPLSDLSVIMGSVYKDAKKAIETPAMYGTHKQDSKGYALQPTSKNPKDLIQFVYFDNEDILNIDEQGVLANREYHYVLPIDEWNELIKIKQEIFWRAEYSPLLEKNNTYSTETVGEIIYTTGVKPGTLTIDNFIWNPVYFDGYLSFVDDSEINFAKKISVANRTEYNKKADSFVTVYNNNANEYLTDGEEGYSLYSEDEITKLINDGENLRITSLLKTRLILPELARNLVENGNNITDTNGWEARTQNINDAGILGTGSNEELLQISVKSTVGQALNIETSNVTDVDYNDYSIDGINNNEEGIKDFYLELLSPIIKNTNDFSLEGIIKRDYALNMGIISQDKKIEKDKVYALQIITGTKIQTGALLKYRNPSYIPHQEYFSKDGTQLQSLLTKDEQIIKDGEIIYLNAEGVYFKDAVESYKNTLRLYKRIIDLFKEPTLEAFLLKSQNELGTKDIFKKEAELFYTIVDRWPLASDKNIKKKLNQADLLLKVVLFGEKDGTDREANVWTTNISTYETEVLSQDRYLGILNVYDNLVSTTKNYEKLKAIGIEPRYDQDKNTYYYIGSDVQFLRTYLYEHIGRQEG